MLNSLHDSSTLLPPIIINAIPAVLDGEEPGRLLEGLLENYKEETINLEVEIKEKLYRSIARASSNISGKNLEPEEMQDLFDRLFACESPETGPGGKKVLTILQVDEIEKRFF